MKKHYALVMLVILFAVTSYPVVSQNKLVFDKYHNYEEVQTSLKSLAATNPGTVKLHTVAQSPGGKDITVLQIGSGNQNVPAIVVGANFEGITPISTEGALYLADTLLKDTNARNITWYIIPSPNPDAEENYFSSVKYEKTTNELKINNDVDELTDEDGFEDLNGDGLITKMRVKDITGTYMISSKDARIMDKAKSKDGERGAYKIYSEGIDNDKDGQYNEDGPGGINVGLNFPHLFKTYLKESGLWAGYSPEVYGIMKFISERPEISMAYTLGTSNFCLVPPKGGRKGSANMNAIKIPRRYASMLSADTEKTYTMDEVIEMTKTVVPPGTEVNASMIANMMGLGAAVNPLEEDLKFYKKYSDEYKEFLKNNSFSTERLDPEKAKDGSFELWAYYHLGIPSFGMNLFTIPKPEREESGETDGFTLEKLEKMSSEDFIAVDEAKIDSFLKANKAPERMKAVKIKEMVKSGNMEPSKIAEMMKQILKPKKEGELTEKDKALLNYIDTKNEGNGFVNWTSYNHPTLGEVEIGGYAPFLSSTPPASEIEDLCSAQIPWLLELTKKLPKIHILEEKVTDMGAGIYKLEIIIENSGELACPIAIGERNSKPAPVVVTLNGDIEFLKGKKRTPLGSIKANQVKKLSWIVKADKSTKISAAIESKGKGNDVKQIEIGG